jgi:molecular chaperone DnaJ
MDFYIILGLSRDATPMDVKRAYRRLARRFHPDINPGDHAAAVRFREIMEAYETLSDPDRRRRYDQLGYQPEPESPAPVGFEGFDFSAAVRSNQESTFGDLFADVLRRERVTHAALQRGADLHATLSLGFEQALRGAECTVTVTRHDRCRTCAGTGGVGASDSPCVQCQGGGSLRSARGHMVFSRTCPRCAGAGVERRQRCHGCGGAGVVPRTEPVTVRVPAGITDGARLRLAEKGHAGLHGGSCGDLYVTVHVQPHTQYRRDGDDLHIVVPVAIHEAALGARVDVPTPDGSARVRVPPGTQSGQRFRFRGRGATSVAQGRRGDLVVEVRIVLPRLLDERSKELLREFGRINTESVRE